MKVKITNFLIILFIVLNKCSKSHARRGPHHPRGEYTVKERKVEVSEHLSHGNEHMQEDLIGMQVKHKDVNEMTEEEKSFYYFKIHDTDNNDNLDGLEMLHAATHRHSNIHKLDDGDSDSEKSDDELNHIIGVIDDFIDFADLDKDGFLNYPEYIKALNANNDDHEVAAVERTPDTFMVKK